MSGKVHGRDGEASCPTRTTTQRFYRPMPLLSLYLVLSLSSSSFSLDRQLCADTRVYVGRARSTVEVHGRDGEASCSTGTTTQRFYRPMPLLSLYLVLSLSSSSFPAYKPRVGRTACRTVSVPRSTHAYVRLTLNVVRM